MVAALMSEPGFQLSSVDYLLGCSSPAAAAAAHQDDASFSFEACTLVLHHSNIILLRVQIVLYDYTEKQLLGAIRLCF